MTNNILVTGGTGFIGSWLAKTWRGVPLVCLSRAAYESHKWCNYPYKYIVHLAPVSPALVLDVARDNNARVLYASSGAVYHPENNTQYRRDKIDHEFECITSGVDVVIARLFTFTGFNVHKTLFDAARAGRPLEVWGDCTRSFMHGAEMARWMWAILTRGESGQAYDVGSDRPVLIERLARRIKALCDTQSEVTRVDRSIPVPVYLPENTAKTRGLLYNYAMKGFLDGFN